MAILYCCVEERQNEISILLNTLFGNMKLKSFSFIKVKEEIDKFSGITTGNENSLRALTLTNLKGERIKTNINDLDEIFYKMVVESLVDPNPQINKFAAFHIAYFFLMFKVFQN